MLHHQDTINGQLEEIMSVINDFGLSKVTLIGHSWGAWMSYLFASIYSKKLKKIILVSSGPFEERYIKEMTNKRDSRLTKEEKERSRELYEIISNSGKIENSILSEFGMLMAKADSYEMAEYEDQIVEFQGNNFQKLMNEFNILRSSKSLLEKGKSIELPIVAIHGDYDPHPYLGVKEPLEKVSKYFKFILLKNCGHTPWSEVYARDEFYKVIRTEI